MQDMLIVTSRYPFPVLGGDKVRLVNIAKEFANKYKITLICISDSKFRDLTLEQEIFHRVIVIKQHMFLAFFRLLASLFSNKPLQVALYELSGVHQAVQAVNQEIKPSLALFHLVRTAPFSTGISCVKILEMTDVISLNYKRTISSLSRWSLKRIIYKYELLKLEAFERDCLDEFDIVTLVSSTDAKLLPANNVMVCSNGADLSANCQGLERVGHKILFIGKMDYLPNFDACNWFIKNVLINLPPHFVFKIVGVAEPKQLEYFSKNPRVEITGRVDSLQAASMDCFCAVAPMRVAAGIQNKVLDYFSLSIPAIISSSAYEGLNANIGSDVLIADDAGDYVQKILLLSSDKCIANSLSENGYNYVNAMHTWKGVSAPLLDRVNYLIQHK